MSKHLKRFLFAYIIVFIPLLFVTESIAWSAVLALLPSWPLLLVWILCDIKHFENCKKFPKEPYIIGDSTKVEYLSLEELEKRFEPGTNSLEVKE
ncbi:hypothetical protein [Thermococcus sp. 21S9]|uniref:hypothetical protein n=1 Tax=Thermococcus sp. 21S9 TaxID=1638223 RepID=UPI00143B65FA|nr:hypothetical protein [Thermococcus sp. 21S9]NJE54338.1 hypothetical protein [Thermococcus sp. 21S9]